MPALPRLNPRWRVSEDDLDQLCLGLCAARQEADDRVAGFVAGAPSRPNSRKGHAVRGDLGVRAEEETRRRAYYTLFVGATPLAIFYSGLALIGIVRGLVSGPSISLTPLATGMVAFLLSAYMFHIRPKVDKVPAWRYVLLLTGILVTTGTANVLVLLFLRNLVLAAAIYPIGGLLAEFVVANRFLKKGGYLPIRIGPGG